MDVLIRWCLRRDMAEILDIEQRCYPDPWDEEGFLKHLRQRNCIGMVAEVENQIVGFMVYDMDPKEIHLLNFAVHPQFWRQGVGTKMFDKLRMKLSQQRRELIRLEVEEKNLKAFFKSQPGCMATRVIRDHCDDGQDAYVFVCSIKAKPQPARHHFTLKNRISKLLGEET